MTRGSAERVLGLENRIRHKLACVLILKAIENASPLLPCGNEPRETHFCQVLRNRSRRLVDYLCQVIHGTLAIPKRQDQPNPRRVCQHRENLDRKFHELTIGLTSTNRFTCIHAHIVS